MSAKKRGLGRGLDALLSSSKPAPSARTEQPNVSEQDVIVQPTSSELQKLPIEAQFDRKGLFSQL